MGDFENEQQQSIFNKPSLTFDDVFKCDNFEKMLRMRDERLIT